MSAAGISSIAISQPPTLNSLQYQRGVDWRQLADSLQSGDLAGAQQAYSDIAALRQNSPHYRHFPNQQVAQDFGALGQALSAGDLAGAQQAFAQFQGDVQAARHLVDGVPRPGPTPDSATPGIIVNLSSGNSGGSASTPAPAPSTGDNPVSTGGSLPPITSTVQGGGSLPPITSTVGSGGTSNGADSASTGSSADIILNLANHGGGNSEQITVNFGQGSNALGQLTLNVSNDNHGSERITLNFGGSQSQPDNIQINLLA